VPKPRDSGKEISADEAKRLTHELDVHQVELEKQNEELRSTQIELSESPEEYLDLYDFAPVCYFSLDRQGNIIRVNQTAANMLGVFRSRLANMPFTGFVVTEDRRIFFVLPA
jgi:PAS domain-containing protein